MIVPETTRLHDVHFSLHLASWAVHERHGATTSVPDVPNQGGGPKGGGARFRPFGVLTFVSAGEVGRGTI